MGSNVCNLFPIIRGVLMGPGGRGDGKEGKFWRIVQCPRLLRILILGLCTAEGIWGCWEGARRASVNCNDPENDLYLLIKCIFSLSPFPPSLKILRTICQKLRVHSSRHPLVPSALSLPLCSRAELIAQAELLGDADLFTYQQTKGENLRWSEGESPFSPYPSTKHFSRA